MMYRLLDIEFHTKLNGFFLVVMLLVLPTLPL